MVSRTLPRFAGYVFRENRVPYYQRLFQREDGKRQWWKTHRSPYILYPYYFSLIFTSGAAFYGMTRMVFNRKTWF
ncbi:uncharacterized protein CIMG_10953 [Coccidioides immitis RS]|uniref:Uncharacterized protein n=6 Tax=Coccidioides TaxID=5500 RepID=A0A0D8JRU6_COCIM|nr:uncharacterized protein CIMG_10953 [Coccidioides immitis RS]EFW22389.1 hypothetical protein CPSG_00288 [Coccidioides posadasii str. Silveira]KMM64066.1 hypothetical protein CPAG_00418 [Coccidioides posadasii RMSCC 3488]KMP10014.1 hypothetical protein CIRG_09247 [Coccidioides immitis RMSCC 2394]KMU81094.1 hypothetical protein CISG_02472 [Coccidioides immitis RMSCC 3703]KMU86526.1 hypothetical protein CIHG_04315 [Coccidioides immitis H538.4]TPX24904.1 hypothetical protein DIZ76_010348 [Cocci